jgi:hypothetical protein
MTMAPGLRKLVLTAHIVSSVGWLGAVAGFLALSVAGLTSQDPRLVRGVYVAMDLIVRQVIVPLALASLLIGIVQALGTTWGLFRHYWVLVKLLVTTAAIVVLLLQLEPIGLLARAAAEATLSSSEFRSARLSLVVHAGGGLIVLLVPTVLSVYKPRGMTPYGQRKQDQDRRPALPAR